jgi:hypothetical protein
VPAAGAEDVAPVDAALSLSARWMLYHMYACNSPGEAGPRLADETTLQAECVAGLRESVATKLPALAQRVIRIGAERSSPLVLHSLYDAASECKWLLMEGEAVEGADVALTLLQEALEVVAKRWGVAGK